MRVEESDTYYQMTEYTLKRESDRLALRWRYPGGITHFFVAVYNARKGIGLEALVREMEDKGLSDEAIVSRKGRLLHTADDGRGKLYLCRREEYQSMGQSYTIPAEEVKGEVPYGISIFFGIYDGEEKQMRLYRPRNPELNTQIVPVKLKPKIRYEQSLADRLFSREKLCILDLSALSRLSDYEEGALMYHVDGVRTSYPLPERCLGRELYILVPKDASVELRVADAYKKYYKV